MPYHLSHLKKLNSAATVPFRFTESVQFFEARQDAATELRYYLRTHLPEIIKDLERLSWLLSDSGYGWLSKRTYHGEPIERGHIDSAMRLTTPTTSRDPSA